MTSNGHASGKPLRTGDPRELDDYRMVSRLGRGGMGAVYLAEDPSGRRVAVKLIHADLADDESFRLRFAREVESARRVARFSTAGVIDARLEGEPLYIVSEFVPGPNLDEAIRADGPMRGGTLDSLALGVAAALTAIHGSGVIHRDLKPANVLLSPVGPKVIDFGIARALDDAGGAATRSSQLMGTPSYMAPELLAGQQATAAADVFAWGCLVAFSGTGSAPFDAPTVQAVLHNISSAPPRLDGVDPTLLDLVSATLDKRPENRPTSQQILAHLTGQSEPEESEVRRTITDSWAPPSGLPVAGSPPPPTVPRPEPGDPTRAQGPPPQNPPPNPPAGQAPQGPPTRVGHVPHTERPAPGQAPHGPGGPWHPPSGPQHGPGAAHQGAGQQGRYLPPPGGDPRGGTPGAAHRSDVRTGPGYAAGQDSPSHGLPGFGPRPGGGGPALPGGPGAPASAPNPRRRGAIAWGAGAAALVLVAVTGAVVLLNRPEPVPENLISLYGHDFGTDPGWPTSAYEEGVSDGYWPETGGVLLQADPASAPSRGEVVPLDPGTAVPDHVLVSAGGYAVEGTEQARFGVRCWDNDGPEARSQYEALLRYDGRRAEIRRVSETTGDTALAQSTEVSGYEPYPLFDEEASAPAGYDPGEPYEFDADQVPVNTVALSCRYVGEDDEDGERMELTMWVNGEHVVSAVDDQPLPQDAEDAEDRRRVGIVTRPGSGNQPIGVLFTDVSVDEVAQE